MSSHAAVFRVDDSGSIVGQAITSMRWRTPVPGRGADNTVEGQVIVALRLDLSRWVHRPARIYMTLAPNANERLIASWLTQGRLLPGSMRGGERALVYEGPIPEAIMQESIVLNLTADGRTLEYPQSLQFNFEIEVSP